MKMARTRILVILWWCVCLTSYCSESAVTLSAKEDTFFKEEAFTCSAYVHFRTDGTYSRIDREHMFVEESDRGTWTQDSNGLVTMKSEMHYRNIEAGPLAVWTWHTNTVEELPRVQGAITSLLRTNSSEHFEHDFIAEHLVLLPSRGTNRYSPISVDSDAKQISRGQLGLLLRAIETFTNGSDNYYFHVAPMRYKEITFLLWRDAETPFNRSFPEIKKSIDRLKRERAKKQVLPLVYTAIDKKTFADEAERTQDFIFHPEMNRPRKEQTDGQK